MKRFLAIWLLLPVLAYAQGKMTGHGAATGNGGLQLNAHISITGFAITPADQQQNLGGLIGYTATLTLSNGDHYVVTRFATWTSNNNSIADPITDPSSFFTVETYQCESPGTIEVKAVYGNQTATTHLTCNGTVPPPPTPVSLAISPLAPSINVGRTQGFTAKETYSDGSFQDVTAAAAWSTSDATIASKGTLGTQQPFTCLKGGAITVTATNDSLTPATTTLTCNAVLTSISIQPATAQILVGGNQTFKATGLYSDGSSQDVTAQATWSSGTPSVAALNGAATGVNPQIFNGIAPGSATLTAAVGTINNTATITVTSSGPPPPTLVSIQVTPANKTINVGSRLNFIATCTYSDGSTAPCSAAPTVWTTSNAAVAPLGITDGFVGGAYSYTLTGTGSTPYIWTVPSAASSGMVDVVDWGAPPAAFRNSFHLTGDSAKYFAVQAGLLEWIKSNTGHPWDLESFNGNTINQDCTEGPTFGNANGYKCYINPPPLWPRYFQLGTNITIDTPGPNFYNITESCGTDHLAAINNQDIRGNLQGSFTDVTWQTTYGGNIPDNTPYLLATKFINGVSGVYQNREQYWLVQGFGQVRWCPATWNGSTYVVGTCSTNTNKVAGGAPTLNFGCGIPNPAAAGALPPGTVQTSGPSLNLGVDTGIISGTPTIAGSYPVTIQQEDAGAAFHLQSQTIRVAATASQVQQTVLGVSAGGPVTITATLGSIHGNTNITVQTPTPTIVSIAVTPNPATVLVNATLGFHALATLSDGTTQDVTASATWASSAPSVAVVLAAGNPQNIKCSIAGASNITATVGAVTSPADVLTCQNPTPPTFGMDAYCGAGNVPSFGTNDSYAALPHTCYYTNPSVFLSPGTVRHASDATTLNTAIAATACGDVIIVDPSSFQGQFTLPSLHCDASHYVTIKGFGLGSLPAYGTAVSPCSANVTSLAGYVNSDGSSIFSGSGCAANMPTITSTVASGTGAVFKIPAGGFSYLIIEGLVLTRTTASGLVTDLCVDGTTGGQFDHFVFYHNWAKGTTGDETNRCMVGNRGSFVAVINNFGSEFHCISGIGSCSDAKFFGGGTNSNAGDTDNTWKVVGNVAASAAQGVLFGGAAAQMIPTDAEIRRNWWFKPPTWNPACTIALCGANYNGGISGHPYIVKNCLENKTGIRFFYEANKCQNGWAGFTQVGNAITLTPKNQSGTLCPICDVHDVTHRYEVIESYWQGMQIANVSDGNGTYAAGGHNYSLHDINLVHMMYKACSQCQGSASEMTLFNAVPATDVLHDVDINHITLVPDAAGTFFASFILGADAARSPSGNFNIKWQNSIWMVGNFGGFQSSSGSPSSCATSPFPTGLAGDTVGIIANCWSNNIVTGNTITPPLILRNNASVPKWPAGTCQLVGTGGGLYGGLTGLAAFNALYTNYNNGAAIGGNYSINPSSKCHNTANDGTDPGANQATLANRMQGVTTF